MTENWSIWNVEGARGGLCLQVSGLCFETRTKCNYIFMEVDILFCFLITEKLPVIYLYVQMHGRDVVSDGGKSKCEEEPISLFVFKSFSIPVRQRDMQPVSQ